LGFVGSDCQQTCPVDGLPHVLDKPPLAQHIYRIDGGSPPRFCAGRQRGDDAFVHLHDANLGVVVNGVELDQPQCRAVEECVEEILRDYGREVERLR
jgi:hypothetical protein